MPAAARSVSSERGSGEARPRVLLVDDSAVVRAVFERIFEIDGTIDLVATVRDAASAIAFLATESVDIVLLDIELPGRSGLDALPDVLTAAGAARVMIVSAYAEDAGPAAIRALELGACDTMAKPGRGVLPGQFAKLLVSKVQRLARSPRRGQVQVPVVPASERPLPAIPQCIGIGASTGGIPALVTMLAELDARIDCPILITQHLPAEFIPFLVGQLGTRTGRCVVIPEPNVRPRRNHVYVAPGHAHLRCRPANGSVIISHSDEPVAVRYRPAVDPMLAGVGECFGAGALGVILTGMGSDGLEGARELVAHGGTMLAQDAQSSVVWGMPGAVAREGLASTIAPPDRLAAVINASLAGVSFA